MSGPCDLIERAPLFLPGIERLLVVLPEVLRKRLHPGVEQVDIVEDLIVGVVLRRDPEHRRLDAQVDVLGDDDDLAIGPQRCRAWRCPGCCCPTAAGQRGRQLQIEQLGLKEQPSGGRERDAAAVGRDGADQKAGVDLVLVRPGHELVEKPADLAHVARHLGQPFFPWSSSSSTIIEAGRCRAPGSERWPSDRASARWCRG
jgi:hypothetical protein